MRFLPVALAVALALPGVADAKGGSHHRSSPRSFHLPRTHEPKSFHEPKHPKADPGVARDDEGKIKRSRKAREDFMHQHPCPSTGKTSGACPGYVVDHVQALKHGGRDDPGNMQWQTTAEAKAKDKWE
jgi:hypothetical protein